MPWITLRVCLGMTGRDSEGAVRCCGTSFGSVSGATLGVSVGVTLEMIEMILWSDLKNVSGGDSGVIYGVTLMWVVD